MVKAMNRQQQEEYVNDFIDSLIMECSPPAPSSMNQEMADMLEAVRGVKRLRSDKVLLEELLVTDPVVPRRKITTRLKPWMKWTSAAAVLFLLVGVVSLVQRMPQLTRTPESAPAMMRSAQPADAPEETFSMAAAGGGGIEDEEAQDAAMKGAGILSEEGELASEPAGTREATNFQSQALQEESLPEPSSQEAPATMREATAETESEDMTEVGIRMMPPSEAAADLAEGGEKEITMFSLEAPLGQQATAVMVRQMDDLYVELRLLDLAAPHQEFRLSERVSQQMQGMQPAQGQLLLVVFEVTEGEIPLVTMLMPLDQAVLQARYLGRIDSRFAEFDINGRLIVMALSEEMQSVFEKWDETAAVSSEQQVQLVIEAAADGAAGLVVGAEKIGE